jgi:hypothetical protein
MFKKSNKRQEELQREQTLMEIRNSLEQIKSKLNKKEVKMAEEEYEEDEELEEEEAQPEPAPAPVKKVKKEKPVQPVLDLPTIAGAIQQIDARLTALEAWSFRLRSA